MWGEGTQLEDQPVYLVSATPNLTIEPRIKVPDDRDVTVETELTLEIEAVRDDDEFWSTTDVLIDETETVSDGTKTASATVSVPELYDRIDKIANQTAGVGKVQTSLHLTTTYDTGQYEGTLENSTMLYVTERSYWLDEPLVDRTRHSTQIQETITQEPNWFLVGLLGGLGVLLSGGAIASELLYRKPIDEEVLRERIARHRYSEWISTGTLTSLFEYEAVHMDSLKEVVDVAIDNNRRVIYDENRSVYAVISDDIVYFYSQSGVWQPFASLFDHEEIDTEELENSFRELTATVDDDAEMEFDR